MRGVFEQKSRRLTYQFRPMSQRQDQRPGILRPPLADRYGQVRRPEREGRGALAADRPWCRAARALGRDRSGVPSRGVNTGQRSPDGSDRRERQIRGGPGLAPGRSPRVRIIRMDDHVTTCRPLLPATSTTPPTVWPRPHRRGRGSLLSGPGRLRLDHRTLGMDAGARIHGLLADRACRPGRDRDMPVLVVHEVQPFREPGLAGRE